MFTTVEAKQKLETIIQEGPRTAELVLQQVMANQPVDFLAPSSKLQFRSNDDALGLSIALNDRQFDMHRNAIRQVSEKMHIPLSYIDHLAKQGRWGFDLLARNLNELIGHQTDRYMLRTVRDQDRAFLSDRYLRVDQPLLLQSFVTATHQLGAVATDATYTDTRVNLRMALPTLHEIAPGEFVIWCMSLRDSSFGNGAHVLSWGVIRLLCINGMIGEDLLRRVHLGSRLGEDLQVSEETYRLDNETLASAIKDVVSQFMGPDVVSRQLEALKRHAEKKITLKTALEQLRKSSQLTKGEADQVVKVFNDGGVEQLPPGDTAWRLANAISWFAKSAEVDRDRGMELEQVAGSVIGLTSKGRFAHLESN